MFHSSFYLQSAPSQVVWKICGTCEGKDEIEVSHSHVHFMIFVLTEPALVSCKAASVVC